MFGCCSYCDIALAIFGGGIAGATLLFTAGAVLYLVREYSLKDIEEISSVSKTILPKLDFLKNQMWLNLSAISFLLSSFVIVFYWIFCDFLFILLAIFYILVGIIIFFILLVSSYWNLSNARSKLNQIKN